MNATLQLDGSSVLQQAQDIVCRRVGGESILVPIRQNVGNLDYVYTLSEVAADVWTLLDGTRRLDEIIDAICERYDIERATAAADVTALVTDLADAALISQVDSGK
jgi:pyrroloquinoline quinone biosynthesis protein D